jgi:hypothetical protein
MNRIDQTGGAIETAALVSIPLPGSFGSAVSEEGR